MQRKLLDWDRKIDVLGLSYRLDWVNLETENLNRLPRWLLFRQPYWGEGEDRRPGGELFLELTQGGGIHGLRMGNVVYDIATSDSSSLYTLVELYWSDDDCTVGDILVYGNDGRFVDNYARRRAEVAAIRAQQAVEQQEQ